MSNKTNQQETLQSSPSNPWDIIIKWYNNACISEPNDPSAASLSTINKNGYPSCRVILLKQFNDAGIHFCTQSSSAKGKDITENDKVSLVLHWKSLRQQIRISGRTSILPSEFADKYFKERSRQSCIAARVSKQSQELTSYNDFIQNYLIETEKFVDKEVSRPENWVAYKITPNYIECWEDGTHRLHKRICYEKQNNDQSNQWKKYFLYP